MPNHEKLTIGIAAGRSKYENYLGWTMKAENVTVIKLSHRDQNLSEISKCDGLILSGGEDVHPRFYNRPSYAEQYNLDDLDEKRDEFELALLEYVEKNEIPLLGICRGLQITNVYFGGTLIPDIPSFGKQDHTKFGEGNDRYHEINVKENSTLMSISGSAHGEVNSSHHQSADRPGEGLAVSATSIDGVTEALEWGSPVNKPYLMLVQWHPERMMDEASPFSLNLRNDFIKNVKKRS